MKAKTRRSLLISSVAMLLVAMLSLGTATYAWFTNTTTATAENAQVTVVAPSGLVINAVTAGGEAPTTGYTSKLDLTSFFSDGKDALSPVSGNAQDGGINFYAASVDTEKNVSKITSGTAFIAIDIYGKLTVSNKNAEGDEIAQDVNLTNISFTNAAAGDVIRCAFYDASNAKKAYLSFGSSQGRAVNPLKATGSDLTGVTTDDNFVLPSTYNTYVEGTALTTAAVTASKIGNAKYAAQAGQKLGTVYFWVEGQDPLCNNANIGTILGTVNNIKLTFDLVE